MVREGWRDVFMMIMMCKVCLFIGGNQRFNEEAEREKKKNERANSK